MERSKLGNEYKAHTHGVTVTSDTEKRSEVAR